MTARRKTPLIMTVGEILYDVFPAYKRLGGAPFNFSFHLHKLGFHTAFFSRIGDDDNGRRMRDQLQAYGFDAGHIQTDPKHPTGWVDVALDDQGSPSFTITPDVAYDYLSFNKDVEAVLPEADLIYFGTLIQRTENGFGFVRKIMERRPPNARCLCDINLRPGCYTPESIRRSLSDCHILKISGDELSELKDRYGRGMADDAFVWKLMADFSIETVSLTLGSRGSALYTDGRRHDIAMDDAEAAADTVGAGDAYAAVLAAGLLLGWPPGTILERGTRFARAVCQIEGAVPESDDFYDDFRKWMAEDDHE